MSSGAMRLGPGMATTIRMRKRRGVVGVVGSARDCCCGGGDDDGGKAAVVVAVESKTWQGISSGRYRGAKYRTIGSFTVHFLFRSYL